MELNYSDKGWFQVQSNEVKQSWNDNPNFKVLDNHSINTNLCVIYFSSNEIFYPNTSAAFNDAIIQRNKFEWGNTKFPNASRNIYVRDVQKQWYIEGINIEINSPNKIHKELEELTKGYTVYTIGSSAGGFAAILFGSLLKAERVYAFNAQFDLNIIINGSSKSVDPILFRYRNDKEVFPYYNLSKFMNGNTKYFYFQSAKSRMDINQFAACTRKDLITKIGFNTKNHGFPFLRHNLLYVLGLPVEKLCLMAKETHHPFIFSIRVDGFINAFRLTAKAVIKRFKKKMYDEKKNAK